MDVFGEDYPETRDGTCLRDYIQVTDLYRRRAFLAGLALSPGPAAQSLVVQLRLWPRLSGQKKVIEVVEAARVRRRLQGFNVAGRRARRPRRHHRQSRPDPARELGWSPKRDDLDVSSSRKRSTGSAAYIIGQPQHARFPLRPEVESCGRRSEIGDAGRADLG